MFSKLFQKKVPKPLPKSAGAAAQRVDRRQEAGADIQDPKVVQISTARGDAANAEVRAGRRATDMAAKGAPQSQDSSPSAALPADDPDYIKAQKREDMPVGQMESMQTGEWPLSEKMMSVMAIFIDDEGRAFFVVNESDVGGPQIAAMRRRLEAANVKIGKTYTVDPGFLSSLYADLGTSKSEVARSKMKRELRDLIEDACVKDASDVHIKRDQKGTTVSFRRNGRLIPKTNWTADFGSEFVRALHTFADEDSKDSSFMDDGSQQMSVDVGLKQGRRAKLRVQTTPSFPDGGQCVVMRVLKVGALVKVKTFIELGYAPDHVKMLSYMMSSPSGLTIIAAPTGSGKTTTLQTVMTGIYEMDSSKALYSIEDPPEYVMPGVVQIPVKRSRNDRGTNPFIQAMKDVMRLDPDDIMVGEIRDSDSVELITAMVQSGHKAFSTTHAGSCMEIFPRLNKLGADLDTLTEDRFMSGLIYQKLVPILCPECKVEYQSDMDLGRDGIHERIHSVSTENDHLFIANSNPENDCTRCKGEGVVGRTVCAEMIIPDNELQKLVRAKDGFQARQYWQRQVKTYPSAQEAIDGSMSGVSALQHGVMKMRLGLISPVDLEQELGYLTGYQQSEAIVNSEMNFMTDGPLDL